VKTHFVGRVGDDVFGRFLAAELERGSGERTMITDRGADEALNPDDLPAQLFRRTDHLHLSGYVLFGSSRRETALEALRLAREAGMSVSVDPSSVPLLKAVGSERFLEWTRGVDLCFPNLQEGPLLGGAGDPGRILDRLVTRYLGVVLKLGARGAMHAGADGERTHLPATPARAVQRMGGRPET
jgi:sugar/nucleoside kinase (ribokinase family)